MDSGDEGSDSGLASPPPVASNGGASSSQAGPSIASSSYTAGPMLPPSTLPAKRKALEQSLDGLGGSGEGDDDNDMGEGQQQQLLAVPAGGIRPAEELDQDVVDKMDLAGVEDVRTVAKLLGSRRLEDTLRVSRSHLRVCDSTDALKLTDLAVSSRTLPTLLPIRHPQTSRGLLRRTRSTHSLSQPITSRSTSRMSCSSSTRCVANERMNEGTRRQALN
jgi:hypothetical protein